MNKNIIHLSNGFQVMDEPTLRSGLEHQGGKNPHKPEIHVSINAKKVRNAQLYEFPIPKGK
jgi:hypothetical protein